MRPLCTSCHRRVVDIVRVSVKDATYDTFWSFSGIILKAAIHNLEIVLSNGISDGFRNPRTAKIIP
jgi:hypothetical protein